LVGTPKKIGKFGKFANRLLSFVVDDPVMRLRNLGCGDHQKGKHYLSTNMPGGQKAKKAKHNRGSHPLTMPFKAIGLKLIHDPAFVGDRTGGLNLLL